MSNDLALYHKILFIDRPWLDTTTAADKYRQQFHETLSENFAQQPLYKLSFPNPLTPKTKYFRAIITNQAVSFLNRVFREVDSALNDNERKYHVRNALSKISAKLSETAKIITGHQLSYSFINDISTDKNLAENAFILQYLKYRLMALYLEIQVNFSEYYSEQGLTIEELHSLYFNDSLENTIERIPKTGRMSKVTPLDANKKELQVVKDDFRGIRKNILSYDEIVADPEKFAGVEKILHAEDLIDEDYNFTGKHKYKQQLAAVYHILINKGYFKKKHFQKPRGIRYTDIRRFLNYRYNCDVDEQYNIWKRSEEKLAGYIEQFNWLEKLAL